MSSLDRRAAARRRAWGRGPMILKFEPLESRQLLTIPPRMLPDLVGASLVTQQNLDWGATVTVEGTIANQGGGATTAPFKVDIYASPSQVVGPGSVLVGSAQVAPGIVGGGTATFSQVVSLPGTPLPNTGATNVVYIDLKINPDKSVVERNYANNQRQGQGVDYVPVTITPITPANLVGAAIGVTPTSLTWGSTFTITAQVSNNSPGDAPVTRARVILTPAGLVPGGPSDVTIDSFAVPAIAGWQSANVVHNVTLPTLPPSTLAGSASFTMSVLYDSDFQTNIELSHQVAQGLGLDQATLNIMPKPAPAPATLPDLAAGGVQLPGASLNWGQVIPVSATVQNVGMADAGPFRVRFVLTGGNGSPSSGLFLGDAIIPGLKAGFSQQVQQTVRIPGRLPSDLNIAGSSFGRIMVMVDPENMVDEKLEINNQAVSAPFALHLPGSDGTASVPSQPKTPANKTPKRPLNPRLRTQDHGLKLVGHKVEKFYKDVLHHLNVFGGSNH